ncbi:MAG: hypothetical protein H0X26_00685 [Alphaproteobacteria bacterium]|nr:hypothetical protein [Alphaproteobacteria bacterium]
MKNTIKTLLILAGIAQGSAVLAEKHSITITSGGNNTYKITPETATCDHQELTKGQVGPIKCEIDMANNIGGRPLFIIQKEGESCAVMVQEIEPFKLGGSSTAACFGTNFSDKNVNLQ